MKRFFGTRLLTVVLLLVSSFFLLSEVKAQADKRQYVIIEYIKVKPAMRANFLKLQKEVWKKVEQERIKQGKISCWELYEVLYPTGSSSEYDYVMYHKVTGWNAIEGISEGNDEIFKKTLSKEQLAMIEKPNDSEEMVKKEIWQVEDKIARADYVPPSKYHLANFMNVADGKWDDYMEMEKTLVKPIHEEQARTGGRAGWSLLALREPDGAARAYQASTLDFFDRWADIGSNDLSDFYSQIHPGKSPEYITRQITGTRSLIRQEIRKLVDYVQ
ncbi:MAG TPA: hypothetical protein VK166_09695 [Chitinophagaceae bacterium]|nr:hypothetical protein [Chitinophagaceae bacterium]